MRPNLNAVTRFSDPIVNFSTRVIFFCQHSENHYLYIHTSVMADVVGSEQPTVAAEAKESSDMSMADAEDNDDSVISNKSSSEEEPTAPVPPVPDAAADAEPEEDVDQLISRREEEDDVIIGG